MWVCSGVVCCSKMSEWNGSILQYTGSGRPGTPVGLGMLMWLLLWILQRRHALTVTLAAAAVGLVRPLLLQNGQGIQHKKVHLVPVLVVLDLLLSLASNGRRFRGSLVDLRRRKAPFLQQRLARGRRRDQFLATPAGLALVLEIGNVDGGRLVRMVPVQRDGGAAGHGGIVPQNLGEFKDLQRGEAYQAAAGVVVAAQ